MSIEISWAFNKIKIKFIWRVSLVYMQSLMISIVPRTKCKAYVSMQIKQKDHQLASKLEFQVCINL